MLINIRALVMMPSEMCDKVFIATIDYVKINVIV